MIHEIYTRRFKSKLSEEIISDQTLSRLDSLMTQIVGWAAGHDESSKVLEQLHEFQGVVSNSALIV